MTLKTQLVIQMKTVSSSSNWENYKRLWSSMSSSLRVLVVFLFCFCIWTFFQLSHCMSRGFSLRRNILNNNNNEFNCLDICRFFFSLFYFIFFNLFSLTLSLRFLCLAHVRCFCLFHLFAFSLFVFFFVVDVRTLNNFSPQKPFCIREFVLLFVCRLYEFLLCVDLGQQNKFIITMSMPCESGQ